MALHLAVSDGGKEITYALSSRFLFLLSFFPFFSYEGGNKNTHIHGKIRFGQSMLPVSCKWEPSFDQKIKVSQKSVGIGRHLEKPFRCVSGALGSINLGGVGMSTKPVCSLLPGLLAQ